MQRITTTVLLVVLLVVGLGVVGWAAQQTHEVVPGDTVTVNCATAFEHATVTSNAFHADCMQHPTPVTMSGYHAPGAHDGLNSHEHGDAPPAWVANAFSQTRESHVGYKGVYDVSPGGVESYFIAHILSTESARSHGDHDFELWLRDPDTGTVIYQDGVLCFSSPCTAPVPERTADTGQRPIVLAERNASDGCETWYSAPGQRWADVGWTICQRYQRFDGTVIGGDGSFRTIDWIVYPERLPADVRALFADDARVEFGIARISFLVNSREYETNGNVSPIN